MIRVTDGVDNNNNSTDFIVAAPLPRNSPYTVTAPAVLSLNPPNAATGIPSNFVPSIVFNKAIVKGSGNITLFDGATPLTPIPVGSSNIVISNNATVTINTPLSPGRSYSIEIDPGAFNDVYGNAFAGIQNNTDWHFTTFDNSVATHPACDL